MSKDKRRVGIVKILSDTISTANDRLRIETDREARKNMIRVRNAAMFRLGEELDKEDDDDSKS